MTRHSDADTAWFIQLPRSRRGAVISTPTIAWRAVGIGGVPDDQRHVRWAVRAWHRQLWGGGLMLHHMARTGAYRRAAHEGQSPSLGGLLASCRSWGLGLTTGERQQIPLYSGN